jgi:hypothetical protein
MALRHDAGLDLTVLQERLEHGEVADAQMPVRLEVPEIAAEEDLAVGGCGWLVGGGQHLVGGGREQRREVGGGVEGALGQADGVARHGGVAPEGEELADHVGGAPTHELGVAAGGRSAAVPRGLVARHGADADGLGHRVEDFGAWRATVRCGVGGDGGPRRVAHEGIEQGATGVVGGPAALDGLGADGSDTLGGRQGAGGLDGGVDAGDGNARPPL